MNEVVQKKTVDEKAEPGIQKTPPARYRIPQIRRARATLRKDILACSGLATPRLARVTLITEPSAPAG